MAFVFVLWAAWCFHCVVQGCAPFYVLDTGDQRAVDHAETGLQTRIPAAAGAAYLFGFPAVYTPDADCPSPKA